MGEAIVITSGKGGVGKSTTAANLGCVLALYGKKVCLVDSDIGLRNLDVLLGLDNRIIYDLVDVTEERCRLGQALIMDKRFECLMLLPAPQTKDKTSVTPEQMKKMVETLRQDYDYVLIDCPAGIEQGFRNAVAGASQSIIVTTPEKSAVRDSDRIIGLLEQEEHIESPKVIVNRIRTNMVRDGDMLDVDEVVRTLAVDLLGVIIDDDAVISAANAGEPIAMSPKTKPGIAYRNIGRRILGESVPLMSLEEKPSFFTRLKKIFGMR